MRLCYQGEFVALEGETSMGLCSQRSEVTEKGNHGSQEGLELAC